MHVFYFMRRMASLVLIQMRHETVVMRKTVGKKLTTLIWPIMNKNHIRVVKLG